MLPMARFVKTAADFHHAAAGAVRGIATWAVAVALTVSRPRVCPHLSVNGSNTPTCVHHILPAGSLATRNSLWVRR